MENWVVRFLALPLKFQVQHFLFSAVSSADEPTKIGAFPKKYEGEGEPTYFDFKH